MRRNRPTSFLSKTLMAFLLFNSFLDAKGRLPEKPPPYAYLAYCINGYNAADCASTTSCNFGQTGTYCPEAFSYCLIVNCLVPTYQNQIVTIVVGQTAGPDIVYTGPPSTSLHIKFPVPTPAPGTTNTFTLLSCVFSNGDVFDVSLAEPVSLTILPGPTNLSISQNGIACFNTTTQLTASAGNATNFSWSNGVSGPTNPVYLPGTYSVTATAGNGCTSTASTVVTNAFPFPLIVYPSGSLCIGQPTTATALPATGATFVWSNGQTGPTINFTPPATFTVTATATGFCTATLTSTFAGSPVPPPPVVNGPGFICPNQTVNLVANGDYSTFLWSTGAQTPNISTTTPGTFSVTATNVEGCTGSATATVTAAVAPTVALSALPDVCQNGCQTIPATLTGAAPFTFMYQIQQNGGVLSSQTVAAPSSPHTFSVCPPGGAGSVVQVVACTVGDAACP